MLELTFGEQVKIVLNRKDMTIKQLAEMIEERTGKKMSRQNLTQRLARDNFQEQDMRLIASILECPFHLSILEENADSEHTTRENIKIDKRDEKNIIDEEPQQLTLNLEYDEPEQVQEEQPVKAREFGISGAERDITIGELVDIHKDLDQMEETSEYADQTEYEEPAEYEEEPQSSEDVEYDKQEDVKDILEEMAAIEAEEKKAREDREEREREREKEQEKEQEKPRGWRAYFPRRKKKQAEAVHEDKQEAATEQLEAESAMNQAQPEDKTEEAVSEEPYQESEEYQEPKEYQEAEEHQELEEYQEAEEYQEPEEYQEAEEYQESEPYQEEEQAYEEYVEENQQDMEEEFADTAQDWEAPEEENVGDINPYTGMEYESNSVRMHPKRIGYVQVYDRSDHQWTDMTEWAFLGYQERKKALLGKDYEPPIYLD